MLKVSQRLYELLFFHSMAATGIKVVDYSQAQVKLSANAKFGFLEPSHGFHAYYAYLRDEDPPLRPTRVGKATKGLLLLGAEYSDDVSGRPKVHALLKDRSLKWLLHVFPE